MTTTRDQTLNVSNTTRRKRREEPPWLLRLLEQVEGVGVDAEKIQETETYG